MEGLTSDSLSVTRNGNKIPYDGIFKKRSTPGPDEFLLVAPGQTLSRKFDVFEGYDVSRAATYSLAVDTYLEYAEGSVKGLKADIPIKISHLSSPTVSFHVVGRMTGNRTPGHRARSLEREKKRGGNSQKSSKTLNIPLDPVVVGTADQQKLTKEIHRAAYHYIKSAISDLQSSPDRAKTWFGKTGSDHKAVKIFELMERVLRSDTITYDFTSKECEGGMFGYTFWGARKIYLCKAYEEAPVFAAYDTKTSTIVHELTHALANVDDVIYGYDKCKNLAKSDPNSAANNADNYNYFVATLFPFNYGFDAMTMLSNGYLYVFKGNMYARYKDGGWTLDPAYPSLMQGNWGNLADNFAQGFDSFLYNKGNGHAYATKGSQYIRYTDGKASTVAEGYPRDISKNWGVSGIFSNGFDSMVQLKNKLTYATKDNLYVRYSNFDLNKVDDGYPHDLSAGGWGDLPEKFKTGFDAMAVLPNGKLYVTRGSQYIRYSDTAGNTIDSGYPKPIKGNWGDVPQ